MRILNLNEQDLCLRILRGHGNNNYLGNIIDHQLQWVCITIIRNPRTVLLEFSYLSGGQVPTDEETDKIIERINEVTVVILEAVNLISLLEKEGYILLLQRTSNVPNENTFGGCIGNRPRTNYRFSDEKISDLLIEYVNKEIYVTDEFREFCSHNFLSREERRFRRQNSNARIAIVVALFAALTNFFFNTWNKLSDGTKIKQAQIDTLSLGLKAIESKLDTLNKSTNKLILEKPIDKKESATKADTAGKSQLLRTKKKDSR